MTVFSKFRNRTWVVDSEIRFRSWLLDDLQLIFLNRKNFADFSKKLAKIFYAATRLASQISTISCAVLDAAELMDLNGHRWRMHNQCIFWVRSRRCQWEFPWKLTWNFTQEALETHAPFSNFHVEFLDNSSNSSTPSPRPTLCTLSERNPSWFTDLETPRKLSFDKKPCTS